MALMAALFAVTLNFLQPLVHAAALRDGSPSMLWTMFCTSAAADPEHKSDATTPAKAAARHECCLGLAHAPALLAPSPAFTALPPLEAAGALSLPSEQRPAVASRDGPHRPRGPPSLA